MSISPSGGRPDPGKRPPPHTPQPGVSSHGHPPPGPMPPQVSQPVHSRTSYLRSLLATAIWLPVNFVIAIAVNQSLPSAEQAGIFLGTAVFPLLATSLVVWGIARATQSPAWPFWRLVLLALPAYFLLALVLNVARMAGAS